MHCPGGRDRADVTLRFRCRNVGRDYHIYPRTGTYLECNEGSLVLRNHFKQVIHSNTWRDVWAGPFPKKERHLNLFSP